MQFKLMLFGVSCTWFFFFCSTPKISYILSAFENCLSLICLMYIHRMTVTKVNA